MSVLLYLKNAYLKECEAVVESVEEGMLILDQTIFYPGGGGQPIDSGKLVFENTGQMQLVKVFKRDGKIFHELEGTFKAKPGQNVKCILDWEKRYRLMQMHTAAHVLAATMHSEIGALITGNKLNTDKTRFDFSMENFDRGTLEQVTIKANNILEKNIDVKTYSLPREKAMEIPGIVKLAKVLPPSIKELRIVEIPGVDVQADGGTHVKNLQEVGKIEILRLENKGKNNRRIYFDLV